MNDVMVHKEFSLKKTVLRILLYFVVVDVCILILYPYFAMFCTALKSRVEIFSPNGTILPITAMWSNFIDIWSRAPMAKYLLNSVLIAGGSTVIAMICGIPAAYALARMKFKGQTAFLGFIIVSQMFAPVVLLVGIYQVMQTLGLTDNLWGLIFVNAAFNQAFTVWLLRGTFMSISPEMEQAATIDGCSRTQAMIVITTGADGACVYDGSALTCVPSVKVEHIVDTIGAGDGHLGAFMANLVLGLDPIAATAKANAAAAALVSVQGGYLTPEQFAAAGLRE